MELTEEMNAAFTQIEETDDCLFITGKAGTGKTTLLKYIVANSKKQLMVAAPTGVAAVNAGGMTLHRLFNIPFGVLSPKEQLKGSFRRNKIEMFKRLELLIIDEISMVRPDVLDYIDNVLKLYRMRDQPFGGVQVVMFGDLYQLPPVIKRSEQDLLLTFYRGECFFYAHAWHKQGFRVIELNHVFRQTEKGFVEMLNRIRKYKLTNKDMEMLDVRRDRRAAKSYDNGHVHICSLKRDVDKINSEMLGEPTNIYKAELTGEFKDNAAPCDIELRLRTGARVMMLANDKDGRYYNGSLGTVQSLTEGLIVVELDNGITVNVEPYQWTIKEYKLDKNKKIVEEEKGSCKQFPVALAWAITIHKSQGLTFDKITIHMKFAFAPGMLYVALSRCTSLKGIISEAFIGQRMLVPNPQLIAFDNACQKHDSVFNKETYRDLRLQ